MNPFDTLARQAGRFATEVQTSLRRARVEGERRLLQRQHRTALEELGARAYELVRAGTVPEGPLAAEIAAVEAKLGEIEAKATEIEQLRTEEEGGDGDGAGAPSESAADASRAAFPMVGDTRPQGGPGPGWEAANRFFSRGS